MTKLVRKLTALKDLLRSQPGELVEWVILVCVALGGMFIGVFDILGHPFALLKDARDVTVLLVGLLTLHFCIERFTVMHRMEKRLEFLDVLGTKEIPPKIKPMVNTFIASHIKLQELRTHANHDNAEFPFIVDAILDEQAAQLKQLSGGKLNVPSAQTAMVNEELMSHYKERYDAVSEKDLDYWSEMRPDAAAYFDVATQAIEKQGTVVTRIFIFSLTDLVKRTNDVVKVLERQHRAKIGWGVAVEEELDIAVTRVPMAPDFALYNGNKAVSVFRKKIDRRFETIFATHENNRDVSTYVKLYRDLVPECWLVNKRFTENYSGALGSGEALERVKKKCEANNKKLNDDLGRQVTEHDVFVLVATKPEQVAEKVAVLARIVNEYRKESGKVDKSA